jgi:thiosulfate reductase cytochrome b subunit
MSDVVHARWVRVSHWILAVSVLTLAVSGFVILMAHPRLYWGEAGNDLMPALIELPIGPNSHGVNYGSRAPIFQDAAGPITANRTTEIFNENGWGRSLHFLAAWFLVIPGLIYLLTGLFGGHFRANIWPRALELAPGLLWLELRDHLRLRIHRTAAGPVYGVLQKCAYSLVVFVAAPLVVLTGLTMSPTVSAAFPFLLRLSGGFQSARTIHFAMFAALLVFVVVHLVMVVASGFWRQMRAMTIGSPSTRPSRSLRGR